MDNPNISIIVPVHNVEKLIRRSVDSILAQSFTDFEVLLIDDGSTDKSGEICVEYSMKDKRVHVYHKQNGGGKFCPSVWTRPCYGGIFHSC